MKKLAILILVGVLGLTACGPALTPAPTLETLAEPTLVDDSAFAVLAVDTYFRQINEAETAADLAQPWDLLTNNAQCNPQDKCELSYFTENWWPVQAVYWLYSCSPSTVIVELHQYERGASALTTAQAPRFLRIELIQSDDGLRIDDIRSAGGVDAGCVPVAPPS